MVVKFSFSRPYLALIKLIIIFLSMTATTLFHISSVVHLSEKLKKVL